jgi:hypothetical protein
MPSIIPVWFVSSVAAGIIAKARGRSGIGYFLLTLLLPPLIGFLLAASLPSDRHSLGNLGILLLSPLLAPLFCILLAMFLRPVTPTD